MNKLIIISSLVLLFGTACNKDVAVDDPDNPDETATYKLEEVASFPLNIAEPSGLCFFNDGTLLTVDDNSNHIFRIDKKGKVLREYPYDGDDLEGVTADTVNQKIWVVNEGKRMLVTLDSSGNFQSEKHIDIDGSDKNKGLEGLSYDPKTQTMYMVNEANPGLLVVLNMVSGKINTTKLTFSEDNSGIYYDATDHSLWIISDKSQKIFHTTIEGKLLYSLDLDYDKGEGIAVDIPNKRVYVVRDKNSSEKFFIYKIVKQ